VVAVEAAEAVEVAVELAEKAALVAEALSGSSSMKAVQRFVTM
jgi:Tfp pilus assembly pilus retraction ATPase PilT